MSRYHYRALLGELRLYLCNHFVNKIPSHTIRLWYYRRIMKFQIGKKSFINLGCKFNCKGNFYLGDFSVINQGSHLDNRGIIFIGNNVSIGPQVKIITADHDLFSENCVGRQKKIEIDDYVFIGYNATLIGNAKMSKGSALGASSLLNRPVEPYCLFVGNPAVKKKIRPSNLNYKMDYNRLFQ